MHKKEIKKWSLNPNSDKIINEAFNKEFKEKLLGVTEPGSLEMPEKIDSYKFT